MEVLAGNKRQVILFDNFEELTKRIVDEFKSKSCGKLGLLRKEQSWDHIINVVCYIAFKANIIKAGTFQTEE